MSYHSRSLHILKYLDQNMKYFLKDSFKFKLYRIFESARSKNTFEISYYNLCKSNDNSNERLKLTKSRISQ